MYHKILMGVTFFSLISESGSEGKE